MTISVFQKKILDWFAKNGRHDLPWRHRTNPYRILISEVMLQQTQVDRVVSYYRVFLKAFPTVRTLAAASPAEVLKKWKGLGYSRRALYLKRAAEKIVTQHKGRFPRAVEDSEKLPGVGHYTARAVSVFAFNMPEVFIETNIRRVFIHFFFRDKKNISDADLVPIIERALYKKNPRLWYSALMDYGALALDGIANPNRQSRHYAKQSRFEGSRRYARAKIVDYLLHNKKATPYQLERYFRTDPHLEHYADGEVLNSLLGVLQKEGFIELKKSAWSLLTNP